MADKPVRADKADTVAELKDKFLTSGATVLTEYRGLKVSQLTQLRRSLGRGLPEQRDPERLPLWRRQQLELLVGDGVEEVDHRGQAQPGLRVAGPGGQDPQARVRGRGDAVLPQRALADPRITLEDQRAGAVLGTEEVRDHAHFLLAGGQGIHGGMMAASGSEPE